MSRATPGVRALLEKLHAAGPVAIPKKRKTKTERTPSLPVGAELAYVAALRKIVKRIGEATRKHIAPIISQVAAPDDTRTDAAGDVLAGVAMEQLRTEVEHILADAVIVGIIGAALTSTNRHNLGEMSRVLGIAPETLSPDLADSMAAWRAENVALIQSIGADYLTEVEGYVTTANVQGIRAEELARVLEERIGVASSRAELIAVDQVLKANAQLSMERMQRVGVTRYEWSTSGDSRVRPGHRVLDGDVYRFDDPPVVDPKSGRRANPGGDYRCRCTALPVFDD